MFLVFNKEKVCSYIIALSTIVIILGIATIISDKNFETAFASSTNKLIPIYNVKTDEKQIAFTMNCAWNADDIDSILDTLSKNKIHITFFIVGDWAEKYPEAVKKIFKAGHEIANHSNTHPHVNNLSLSENTAEIEKASEKIEKITGKSTNLYRAPYGEYNNTVLNAATEKNHKTIQWNLDILTTVYKENLKSLNC